MMVAFSVKNKVAFIDGSLPMPTIADPTYAAWTRGNNLVISWLYNSVSKDIISSILFANTTKEIWEDLKTRFSRKNDPRIFQLRRQLMSLQQGSDDVNTYYTKLKSVWEELSGYKPTFQCKCGGLQTLQDYTKSEYVMSFLMGLNDNFAQDQGQILLYDPLPPIGNVFSLVLQEKAQREIVVNHLPSLNSNTMAFTVNSTTKNPTNGKSRNAKKERPQCAHSNLLGHTKDKCYKLVGYPPNYFKNKPQQTTNQVTDHDEFPSHGATNTLSTAQCQQLISFLTKQLNTENNADTLATNVLGICMNTSFDSNESCHYWILDSGETSHICCSKEQFNSFKSLHVSHVLLPNSTKVKVEGIGRIKLNDDIFLHNMLFIPTFRFNLLSLVSLINDNSFQFIMQPNSFVLQDLKTLRRIDTARQHQGLLLFNFPKSPFHDTSIQSCNVVTYETWHQRLGHIPIPVYKLICNKVPLLIPNFIVKFALLPNKTY